MVSWRDPDLWCGCVRTVMAVADTGTILFYLRSPLEVDARLRKRLGRRGKLTALIIVILNTIDLTTVPVLEVDSNRGELLATTVKLPKDLHANLRQVARLRQTSMNALMNSAIWTYTEDQEDRQTTA
jgi:hypothetical protein